MATEKSGAKRPALKSKPKLQQLQLRDSWRGSLGEPSTWAGVATIASVLASNGAAALVNPAAIAQIVAGISMIALKEVSIQPEE